MKLHVLLPLLALLPIQTQAQQSLGDVARQLRATKPQETTPVPSSANSLAFPQPRTATGPDRAAKDGQAEADKYLAEVRELFAQERFDQIDFMAHTARTEKSRFPGGGWKLFTLYLGLGAPSDESATDELWQAHIAALKSWIARNPSSITPRVALAMSYTNYGWKARGTGTSDRVSEDGWQLFEQRLAQARSTLDAAARLPEKCPQWYRAMQTLALGQGWDRDQEAELFKQAIAFEPDYSYFYRAHAHYLLPKWYGEEGESEKFAQKVSAQVGGDSGKILYFEIAAELICGCNNDVDLQSMSWPKIQSGYATNERLYGSSTYRLNQLAYMAAQMKDTAVSEEAFERLGDDWNKAIWRSRQNFDQWRAWAAMGSESIRVARVAEAAIAANMKTPAGQQYDATVAREFQENFGQAMQECAQRSPGNMQGFDLYLIVAQNGAIRRSIASPQSALNMCLLGKMYSYKFSPPPAPDYWVKITMNMAP